MNIQVVLESLAKKRPVFHNEADFQHALAWELRELYDCSIRLETRMDIAPNRRAYLDILLEKDGRRTAIELKYKMRAIEYTLDGESFSLLNQGAQDIGRYDVLKDLQRLEQMVKRNLVDEGYLIYLTNDTSYFIDPGFEKLTADREFRIHEGRIISGTMAWSENTGMGTMKGREEPIVIEGKYMMNWQPYSVLDHTASGRINSLIVPVNLEIQQSEPLEPQINDTQEDPEPMVVLLEEANQTSMEIASIIKSINSIPVSQNDLRDKLGRQLQAEGYHIQINRDFVRDKVDLWAEKGNERIVIEVRYKTALLHTIHNGIDIHLKNQAAQDISRYDFLKDLEKLEKVTAQRPGTKGYAVLITNDRNYWDKSTRVTSVDEEFRIHQGRFVQGLLTWQNASGGTTFNREQAIHIKGQYRLNWQPFLTIGQGKNESFQMLIVEVIGTQLE
jgi:hypothetical protein